jgi:FkbM family methyltransferase
VPCALPNVAYGSLLLRNKWQVSSTREVFLSAHYWRLFEHLETPPGFVVDLGGHCGHFPVLCELVIQERFGKSDARYLIVEGFAELVQNIHATLADTGFAERCTVVHGLVGLRSGVGQLRSGLRNLLETSVKSTAGVERGGEVPYINPLQYIPEGQPIDILKIDIEGSEYDLVTSYPELFARARLVLMELHDVGRPPEDVLRPLHEAGLRPCLPEISKWPNRLLLFKRP